MTQPIQKPADGPLHERWGPYIRNVQPVGDDLFLVEGQRGTKGTGKIWNPMIIRLNPNYNPNLAWQHYRHRWEEIGVVKNGTRNRGVGMFKVMMYVYPNYDPKASRNIHRYVEAYFETELLAVQFMIRNAPEFIKP